jgi:hypothetical protein
VWVLQALHSGTAIVSGFHVAGVAVNADAQPFVLPVLSMGESGVVHLN